MNDEPDIDAPERRPNVSGTDDRTREPAERSPVVTEVARIMMGVGRTSPTHNPLLDKLDSEHIGKIIEYAHERDMDRRRLQWRNKWLNLAYVFIALTFFVFLTMRLLPEHGDLYMEILEIVGATALGAVGGYGFKAYRDRRRS